MIAARTRKRRPSRGINLTPMIDMTFQLIVFLVLIAHFVDTPSIDLRLPEAGTAEATNVETPRISLGRDGGIFWNAEPISDFSALDTRLALYKRIARNDEIQLAADKDAPYGRVASVMDHCRKNGLGNIIMGMEKPE